MANTSGYKRSTQFNRQSMGYANRILNRLPWGINIMDNIAELNPKFERFSELIPSRQDRLSKMSVFDGQNSYTDVMSTGALLGDPRFQAFMYASIDLDKGRRLAEYHNMASFSTVSDCLDEIADELLFEAEDNQFVKLKISGIKDKLVKQEIEKEWQHFVDIFEFKEKGWERFRRFLIEGELYFENVVSENRKDLGIVGLVEIPTELIAPVYDNVQNNKIASYILRRPVLNQKTQEIDHEDMIAMEKRQITYIDSGLRNNDGTIVLPYIENARRAYRQLTMMEDSLVIYRMTRSPEKLLFKINTGNMSPPNAEAYIKRLMQQFWSRKTYDPHNGRPTSVFDPQSATDSFWFPLRDGASQQTDVTNLTTNAKFGEMDDLLYFQRQLYNAMHVPTQRLNPEYVAKDGAEASAEEVRFGKYIKRIQRRFALGMKDTFMTHLKMRGFWKSFNLHSYDFDIEFNVSSIFEETRRQQYLDLCYNNFNQMAQNDGISNTWAQKKYLHLTDAEIKANIEWKKMDAQLAWELQNITQNGPGWKKKFQQEQNMEADLMNQISGAGEGTGVEGAPPPDLGGAGAPPIEGGGAPAPAAPEAAPAPAAGGEGGLPQPLGPLQ
jgi:hypothetical protein